MKKYIYIILNILFCFTTNFVVAQIQDSTHFYYAKGIPHYYINDSTSINIIVKNIENYDSIVSNLHLIFNNPKDEIISSNEDDNVIINSDQLLNLNFDTLISNIKVSSDDIKFISYKKTVNNRSIWFRNEIYVKLIDSSYYYTFLEPILLNYSNFQIQYEGRNTYKIVFSNETSMISAANTLYDTSKVLFSSPDFYSEYKRSSINDPYFPLQWNLNNTIEGLDIKAIPAWIFLQNHIGTLGSEIIIAVIDDGVEPHEDFYDQNGQSRVLEGYTVNGNGTGRPRENHYHGQLISGIIAAGVNSIGIAGIAPNSKIIPIRIFKNNSSPFSNYRISRGIEKAWSEFNASILNMSWGQHNEWSDLVEDAIKDALENGRDGKGCIVIAASGNDNWDEVDFPSSVEGVISVGGVDRCGMRSGESQHIIDEGGSCDPWEDDPVYQKASCYGDKLSVVAPGSSIISTDRMGDYGKTEGNYYEHCDGTSAAAPHVAAIAALILSVNPTLNYTQVRNIIESTTSKHPWYSFNVIKPNGSWNNKLGYGFVDALKAIGKTVYGTPIIAGETELIPCEIYNYNYNINNSELFTYNWYSSSNIVIANKNNNSVDIIPISSGNGYIGVFVYYQNEVIFEYQKNVNINGSSASLHIPISSWSLNINSNFSYSNNNHLLYTDLFINSGAILTITGSVFCTENAKIIVKPGGKLVLDGGTLTNYCSNKPWQGIVIEGNSTQSQIGTTPNQGVVIVKNNAIIENAICGIKVGDTQDPSKNGGIIYASETQFKNCKNAVLFAPYKNINNSVELANRSKFTDCEFIVDDNFYTAGMFFDAHAKLLGVNGITFTGCSFSNTQTTTYPSSRRYASSGISSFNSGFTVRPKCLSNLIPGEICTQNDIDIASTFTGLDYGIVAQGGDDFYKITVLSTQFNKNDYGIYLSGVNNAKILNNSFIIGKDINNIVSNPVGLYIQNGSGFRIEENIFNYNQNIYLARTGLVVKNSGKDNNQIYNNTFTNLTDGQIFDGLNYSTKNPFEGLVSLCNNNIGNKDNDFCVRTIDGYNYNGVNQYQGEVFNTGSMMNIVAAGNTFSNIILPGMQYKNYGNYLFYMYYPYNSTEILNIYSSTTISREIATENFCPSKINSLNIQTIQSELTNITFSYGNLKYNYNQLIDAGNTPELIRLIQDVWSEDIWNLRNQLMSKSPYLSQEAIISVAQENLLPPALLLEICIANPDATKDQGFLDLLRYEIPTPLPEYMINLIIASWDERTLRTELEEQLAAFKTYKDEYQNYKTEFLLSDSIIDYSQIKTHLETRGAYVDFLSLSEIAISQNNFQYATLYMDILENSIEKLTLEESTEVSSFKDYISIRESIFLSGKTIYNLDSTQIASLETYASSNNYRGAILARNILCFLYDICIEDVPAPPKMLRIGSNGNNNQNSTPFIASVKVMPNPAHEYASFIWDMKSFDKSSILYIYDQNGKIIETQPIDTKQGQWVWNIKNVPNGVYVYTLKSDQLILYSGKIIVNK